MTRQQRIIRSSRGVSHRKGNQASSGRPKYWFLIHYLTVGPREALQERCKPIEEFEEAESTKIRRLEAALFLSREGLTSRKLSKIAGLADATEARTLIRRLNEVYAADGRAFKIEELAGGYTLLTRSRFAGWLRRMAHIPGEKKLSQSAIETLSIVGYRQPVLRAEVEAVRGVGCSEVLRQLMELDLVRISGRSDDLGRPYLYGTTRRFLQMFGLRSADHLPRRAWVDELKMALTSPEIAATESEVKESTVTKSLISQAALEEEPLAADRLQERPTLVSSPGEEEFFDENEDDENEEEDGEDEEEDGGEDEDEVDGEDDEDEFDDEDDWDDDEASEDDDDVEDEDIDEKDIDEKDIDEKDIDEDEEDDLEEQNEWQEVSDDDDGWEDDDDEDDDDDEWEEEEDGEVEWD